ncbi:hypothetical protein IAT38_003389 [Cryptococcus sp. DSM 104549]
MSAQPKQYPPLPSHNYHCTHRTQPSFKPEKEHRQEEFFSECEPSSRPSYGITIAPRNLLTPPSNLPPPTLASAPSPATSLHSPTTHLTSLPRTKHSNSTAASSSSTRTAAARQRAKGKAPARRGVVEDSDSDLTPASGSSDDDADMTGDDDEVDHDDEDEEEDEEDEGEDDDDEYENLVTPRKGAHKGRSTPTQAALMSSGGAHGAAGSSSLRKKKPGSGVKSKAVGKKKSHPADVPAVSTASASTSKSKVVKTTAGPAGREKKRAIKIEEAAKRRARDAKFDVDGDFGGAVTPSQSMTHPRPQVEADDTSSYGDDESEHGNVTEDEPAFAGLPEAFMGQEVEDLAYGGGDMDDVMAFWEDQETDEEDEQMFIDNLSGSEVDRQSQSSVSIDDSDDSMSDSDFSSSTDDGLDEFGFPIPSATHFPIEDAEGGVDPGLVLMENWDGQFVLVQPRAERSRSRHRGERGSRTAGSVSGSTVASGTEQQGEGLLIDPDAAEHEFDSDSASYWSGMSDEDDGGDTTDSMAEEDMPMLDSPALNELMESQMAEAVLRMAVDAGDVSAMMPLPEAITAAGEPDMGAMGGAGLLVGDGLDVHTPALSTSSSNGPITAPSANLPQTPGPAPAVVTPSLPAPNLIPQMGTFHPTTGDPAQHAVIDGSGTTTKSPFTHRRRSRRNRDAASMASSSRSKEEKKRKSSAHSHPTDPFSPALSAVLAMGAGSAGNGAANAAGKRMRYSSIPGHPRYVAARRAQQQALVDPQDRETTPSDSDAFSLEDMLETEVLMHELGEGGGAGGVGGGASGDDAEHLRHMIRFDRVGVSTYLRRNFGPGARIEMPHHAPNAAGLAALAAHAGGAGGVGGVGSPSGGRARALDDTLVGPMGGRMLMSPVLGAVDEEREARRERRRRKKAAGTGAGMPELKI